MESNCHTSGTAKAPRRLGRWVWLAAALAIGAGLYACVNVARREARQYMLGDRLRCFSWVIRQYRDVHGDFPPDLEVELPFHHCFDSLDAYAWGDHRINYIKPESGTADQAVLYLWPPYRGGTAVFFMDITDGPLNRKGEWVELDEHGNLVHPRTGELIAKGGADIR